MVNTVTSSPNAPDRIAKGPSRFTPRAKLECLLCKGNHFVSDCPSLPATQQATARSGQVQVAEPQKPVSAPSTRPSAPNETSAVSKRNGTAVLNEPFVRDDLLLEIEPLFLSVATPQSDSSVQVIDPALPAMSEESTPGTPQMQLFFVLGVVQTLPVWILADAGSVRNLIDESVFNCLPFKPRIKDPGNVRIIGGNGEALNLKGFAVLPVSLGLNHI